VHELLVLNELWILNYGFLIGSPFNDQQSTTGPDAMGFPDGIEYCPIFFSLYMIQSTKTRLMSRDMRLSIKIILFTVLVLRFTVILSSQTNYYVTTTGSNGNNGTTPALAWKTIQHAMDQATPNSVVHILAGTYNEKVEVNVSGTAGNTITFQNYQDDNVTLSGNGISSHDAIIGIFDQSYIIIQGLHISDNQQLDAQGIIVEGNCQNIEIRNNKISHIHFSSDPNAPVNAGTNSQPIIVYGSNSGIAISNLVIDSNIIRDSRTGFSEGLAVNGNVDGFEVTNNIVHEITNIGIDLIGHEGTASSNDQARNGLVKGNTVYQCKSPYATAAGIYVDGAKDIIIENNQIFQNQWGIEVGCEHIGKSASGIEVRNNIIYGNDDAGLVIGGYDYPAGSGKVTDCLLTNNSCYNNDVLTGGIGGVTGELQITYTENCVLENNIFYAANASDLVLYVDPVNSVNLDLNYNLYYISGSTAFEYEGTTYTSFASYQSGTSQDSNSQFSDPRFVDPSMSDFHLMVSSPARDTGNPSFLAAPGEVDLDDEARIQNDRVDIGADEFSTTLSAHIVTEHDAILIYPNPFSDKVVVDGDFSQFEIMVFDAAGVLVTDLTGTSNPLTIDLNVLGPGIYFISIQHETLGPLGIYKMLKQ
jgi:hypothetical protein